MPGRLRLRSFVDDSFDAERHSRGNLFELPPVLYRQTEAGGHGGPRRAFPEEIRQKEREGFRLIADANIKIRAVRKRRSRIEDRGSRIEDRAIAREAILDLRSSILDFSEGSGG